MHSINCTADIKLSRQLGAWLRSNGAEKDQRFKEIKASWKIYMEQNIRDQERRWNLVRFCGVICTLQTVQG